MARKTDPAHRIDEALLEMARDGLLSKPTSEKITMRILGGQARETASLVALEPAEIRALRERANMSQAVFARLLNVTTGYVSQLERGVRRPTGPALALLNVIKRKGVEAVL
jgi:putative transcriptional regulator